MREALGRWDFGLVSRRVRECTSLRQEDIAALTGFTQGYLSMLESGARKLTNIDRAVDFLVRLAVPPELVRLPRSPYRSAGPDAAASEESALPTRPEIPDPELPWTADRMVAALNDVALGDSMDRRRFLTISGVALTSLIHHWSIADAEPVLRAGTGDQIGSALLGHLQGTIDELRRMDAAGGSGNLADLASAHLALITSTLKHATYDEATGRSLAGIAADTATQLGWFHFDAGHHAQAQQALTAALRAAQASEDPRLGAGALSYIAIHAYSTGNPRDAVNAMQAARASTKSVRSPVLQAMLLTRQARGHAVLGEREACERALGRAGEFAAKGPSDEDPAWLYWINPGEILGQTASCYLALGDSRLAAENFHHAQGALNPSERRTRALFEARAASAFLRSGERDAAYDAGERALGLAQQVQSARLGEHLAALSSELQQVSDRSGRAQELVDQSMDLLAKGTPSE